MKMLAFYVIAAAILIGAAILTARATSGWGFLVSGLLTLAASATALILTAMVAQAIERRFGVQIIER